MTFELVTSGNGIWHVHYMQLGVISRTYCEKKIRNPIATNMGFMPKESVCKKCARLCCDLEKSITV